MITRALCACVLLIAATASRADISLQCSIDGAPPGSAGYAGCVLKAAAASEDSLQALRDQCWGAMLSRPSSNGASASMDAARRCALDPAAHLRTDPRIQCAVTRNAFGRIDGAICQGAQ